MPPSAPPEPPIKGAGAAFGAALDRAEEIFMAAALAFMTLVTFVQVVLRYAFGTGFVWSLEATTYTFAWLVLIGMSYCVRMRAHIAVELATAALPPRAMRAVALLALAASLAYCALMIYGSAAFVGRLYTLGNYARDIPLPRWVLTAIMPAAFALLGFRLVQAAWSTLRGTGSSPQHEAPPQPRRDAAPTRARPGRGSGFDA